VVEGVVEDVIERVVVLLFGLDHFGPEALPEDVMLSAVSFVEGAGVLAVEVAHPFGEIRERRLDNEVVVVPEEAASVQAPAIVPTYSSEDLEEHDAIPVVEKDRRVVVPFCAHVVVGAGGEVTVQASHAATVTAPRSAKRRLAYLGAKAPRTRHVPGT
jgi:hypothetical protein